MAKQAVATTKITRDDLEQRFRAIQEGAKAKVDDQRSTLATVAGIGGVLLVLLVFLLGRRSGKKRTTLVEIRRV
jgi:hypothetical protein